MRSMKSCKLLTPVLLAVWLMCAAAPAQTFKVLHTFTGAPKDGEGPTGVLVLDPAGNIYGTTLGGGSGTCVPSATCGTAFMLNKTGTEVGHINFGLMNGSGPWAGPLRDAEGNFYGTTNLGGDTTCFQYGCGTVYKVSKTGKQTILHEFAGSPDGDEPFAPLVEDLEGNLYGTTYLGGIMFQDAGTIFKIDSEGNETILYNFCSQANCMDGAGPLLEWFAMWPGTYTA